MKSGENELKHLYWQSRRGMLELDLLLVPFAKEYLGQLPASELALYRELLQEEDQDLYQWLLRRTIAPTENLRWIVNLILDKNLLQKQGTVL
jgi:antitoxin CptB